jgi:hypothetical protein
MHTSVANILFIVARKVARDFTQFATPSKRQESSATNNGKTLGLLKSASAKCVFTKREEIPFGLLPPRRESEYEEIAVWVAIPFDKFLQKQKMRNLYIEKQTNRSGGGKTAAERERKMKKVKIKDDIRIIGYGMLHKGEIFYVEKHNNRFVYVRLGMCELRLSVKEVEVVK